MKYVFGNWKMNLSSPEVDSFLSEIAKVRWNKSHTEVALFPQAIYLERGMHWSLQNNADLFWGAQNVSEHEWGAYTGELSPMALKQLGINYTLLGHSERRQYFSETDSLLEKKLQQSLKAKLKVVFCIGETLEERQAQKTFEVLSGQLNSTLLKLSPIELTQVIIAYEPVWAIGTGVTATPLQAGEVHKFIFQSFQQKGLSSPDILYGGSVNEKNFEELLAMPHIHGGLIGGASLKPSSFAALINLANNAK